MLRQSLRKIRKGQAMVEYALLVACVFIVGAVAASMLGHKTADTIGIGAVAASMLGHKTADTIMPGAHTIGIGNIVIDTANLQTPDRFSSVLGAGGAALVIK